MVTNDTIGYQWYHSLPMSPLVKFPVVPLGEPLYRLALVLVLGLIVWKWVNLEHSMDSNQECGIGFGNLPGSLSHFLAYSRKLGNRRSSEGLRSF